MRGKKKWQEYRGAEGGGGRRSVLGLKKEKGGGNIHEGD